jgi:hypothetical protein
MIGPTGADPGHVADAIEQSYNRVAPEKRLQPVARTRGPVAQLVRAEDS